jgi:hypothetical protein
MPVSIQGGLDFMAEKEQPARWYGFFVDGHRLKIQSFALSPGADMPGMLFDGNSMKITGNPIGTELNDGHFVPYVDADVLNGRKKA